MTERTLVRAAEVALALVTFAAVIGMTRLFQGGSWVAPLLANAAAAHLVAVVLRRRGLPVSLAMAATIPIAGLVVVWSCYWSTTVAGVPTGRTISTAHDDLTTAWSLYQHVVAPTPARTGFILVSAVVIWVIAFVADWAAFRLWVPFESTLPAGTLFLFTALLGTKAGRSWAVAIYAATLLAFLLLHRLARQEGTTHWVAERRSAGHRSLLVGGAAIAAVAVAAGALLGPNLPGANASGILDPHDLNGDDAPRVTISPLVDIRSRLVDQANVEVFTVRSTERSYWRLTSLERFDGRIWSSSGSYGKAGGHLPEAVGTDAVTQPVQETFAISGLSAIWLPTAYEAKSFKGPGVDARFDEDSSTLIVSSKVPTSDGLTYSVTSASPRITPADLNGTAGEVPTGIRKEYDALPADFSPRVRQLAAEITKDAKTPYAQARALQDYLRTFTYDLNVPPGHSGNDLESFLFTTKRGYCEQFAGAYAAMARAVGLPARVAVGFTPGEEDPTQPGLYRVRGEHAHAWPEVYFAGVGWVAFEPTPGRGMPGAEAYTGVPEQQAAPGHPDTATTVAGATPGTGGTTPTTAAIPGGNQAGAGGDQGTQGKGDDSLLHRYAVHPTERAVPWLLLLLALYGIGVPVALSVHRRRRRARATTADARIVLAWVEAVEAAQLVGFVEHASDTYAEGAERLGDVLPTAIDSAQALARTRELADYSPAGAGEAEAITATDAGRDVVATAHELAPRGALVQRWLDPRPELRAWRRGRAAGRRHIDTVATGSRDLEDDRGRRPTSVSD